MPSVRSRMQAAASQHAGASPGTERHWAKTVVQVLLKLAYPALILCAWRWDTPRYVGCMLFAILWLQRWAGSGPVATSLRRLSTIDWTVVGLLSCASAAIVFTNSELLLRLYPSLVNLGLLVAFGATLVRGPSMIEKFARLGNPNLPRWRRALYAARDPGVVRVSSR